MTSLLFDRTREYLNSGKANSDQRANLLAWKSRPSRYKFEALISYLIERGESKTIEALCFNPHFIISLSKFVPDRPDMFRKFSSALFKRKRVLKAALIARLGLIDRAYQILNVSGAGKISPSNLIDHVEREFQDSLHSRFLVLLLLHCRSLLDSDTTESLHDRLFVMARTLRISLASEDTKTPESDDGIDEAVGAIIADIFPIILDFDPSLAEPLVFLLSLEDSDLIDFLAQHWKPSREKYIRAIVNQKGPIKFESLPSLRLSIEPSGHVLKRHAVVAFRNYLRRIRLYSHLELLPPNYKQIVAGQLEWLWGNMALFNTNKSLWRIASTFEEPSEFICDEIRYYILEQEVAKDVKWVFLRFLESRSGKWAESPYSTISRRISETIWIDGADHALSLVLSEPAWLQLSVLLKTFFLVTFPIVEIGKEAPLRKYLKSLAGRDLALAYLFYPACWLLGRLLLTIKSLTGGEKRNIYSLPDFKKLNKIFKDRGAPLIERILRMDPRRAGKSKVPNYRRVKSDIERLCNGYGNRFLKTNLDCWEVGRKYDDSLPYSIDGPVVPLLLPLSMYRRIVRLTRNLSSMDSALLELSIKTSMHPHEYLIPSRLFARYLSIPRRCRELARLDKSAGLVFAKAFQLKRAAGFRARLNSYRSRDSLILYCKEVSKRFCEIS